MANILGSHHTETTKTKMKLAHLRRKLLGLPGANKGRKLSKQWRENLSKAFSGEKNPMFGKHRSQSTKNKISEGRKGKHYPKLSQALKKNIREKSNHWKGGKTFKSGYTLISSPNHPFKNSTGYVYEHRLIVEEHLKRYLKFSESIHHINSIRSDNRLENLYLFFSNPAHIGYHSLLKYQPNLVKPILKSNLL